jgi:2,3-bisphosphoglycerate-independent phosphoglycerate mutase
MGRCSRNTKLIMSRSPHVLFVFLDGVGLGVADPSVNPLASASRSGFEQLAGGQSWTQNMIPVAKPGHLVLAIDANLGVEGLPQSGTGQATLFTGVNCAERAGRHFGPFPHSTSKPVIASENLFSQIKRLGSSYTTAFANAYPDRFFKFVERRNRWTVTTLCCVEAGVPLRTDVELQACEALAADLTGEGWGSLGYELDPIDEAEAGRRLVRLSQKHTFTLFEYYLTDKAGHSQDKAKAESVLDALDRFWEGILSAFDFHKDVLIITSDHGNIEDLSTKSHTRNSVPFIAFGRGAEHLADVRSLVDVTPALVQVVQSDSP